MIEKFSKRKDQEKILVSFFHPLTKLISLQFPRSMKQSNTKQLNTFLARHISTRRPLVVRKKQERFMKKL